MRRALAATIACALAIAPLGARADEDDDLARYVNPFIGTLGGGFTFPGAAAPYGMAQVSPDTEGQFAYTGYQYADQFIRGFSMVHTESMGVREGGQIPFMPTTGAIVTDVKSYQSPFSHADEEASPGYYRARLLRYGINAELTAGTRVGIQRYTFPRTAATGNVLIDVGRQIDGGPTDDVQSTPGKNIATVDVVDARTVTGTATPLNPTDRDAYTVHFAARFDRDMAARGVWSARGAAPTDASHASGAGAGAYATFDTSGDSDVVMKVGISFVSTANALTNLEAELPGDDFDFDGLRARTRAAWNDALRAIVVQGGTVADKTSFYTALYHAQHHPNTFNDANGQYLGYDNATHTIGADGVMPAGSTYYANFSLWDTYRAEMPLLEMISPARVADMMRSLAAIKLQGGRLPKWGLMNRYADYMIGEPALQTVADAFCRNVVPADVSEILYDGMLDLAVNNPYHHGPMFEADKYVAHDRSDSGASVTLETASGEFAFALVADRLGRVADRDAALERAGWWRNLFDPQTRFIRPRLANGNFMADYHPELPDGFVEGTGWQWSWLVPHDVAGLADAMDAGAPVGDATIDRLDTFFSYPAAATVPVAVGQAQTTATVFGIAYYGNQYAPSNEHDLQAPYLYSWLGQPWKTEALARQHQGLFRPTPDGMPGNDDLGTMSAWFVWSALGLYPVIPGAPLNVIGSPVFERASIRLPDGTFTIEAPGASLANKYVQTVSLDGVASNATYVPTAAMADGRTLRLTMGPVPNEARASDIPPPSQPASGQPLDAFGC